jgi:heptosyltransferase-2
MQVQFQRVLIIQTAFIGDVILSTSLIEKLHSHNPDAQIDFLLRKGNEGVLKGHPLIKNLWIWDKKGGKYKNLLKLLSKVRSRNYDLVVNLQRFATTGLFTAFSGGKIKVGFDKNPFSFLFSKRIKHEIGIEHEVQRNLKLISEFTNDEFVKPKIYPGPEDLDFVAAYKSEKYICIAPGSVWFTKQYPKEKWIELTDQLPEDMKVYLLGGSSDVSISEGIIAGSGNKKIESLIGKLSLLQSAALMRDAEMNFVNDSGPMHLASAVNAKTVAIYCSTVPSFGFGPLADQSSIVQTKVDLPCKPCGLHGYPQCPLGHFKCAYTIEVGQLLNKLELVKN